MKIEIVMTTFNGMKYLKEQLDSIRMQTRYPDYVSIFDDKSSDGTVVYLKAYIEKYSLKNWNIFVGEENKGWKQNFMNGFMASSADLIFPCDQDDIWMLDKIEKMERLMIENLNIECLVSRFDAVYMDASKKLLKKNIYRGYLDRRLYELKREEPGSNTGCCMCFRKNTLLEIVQHWKPIMSYDTWIWHCCNARNSLYMYNESLIKHRLYSSSVTGKKLRKCDKRQLQCEEEMEYVLIKENSLKNKASKAGNDFINQCRALEGKKRYYQSRIECLRSKNLGAAWRALKSSGGNYYAIRAVLGDLYTMAING